MMDGPWTTIGAVAAYLYVVLVLGPRLMANQKPFSLRQLLIGYNAAQVLFSLFMFWELKHECTALHFQMVTLCWWYYISKLTEFADTIFFVLRKKDSQITPLHLYHHCLTPLETWICVKYIGGGHGTFSNLINNLVHIIMYSYYLLAAMGPEYSKYLWWKKYLTSIQMMQFALVFIHSAQVFFISCSYPRIVAAFLLLHSSIFFGLFMDFYCTAYSVSWQDIKARWRIKLQINVIKKEDHQK
ncbi:hypothetical protein J437_LFUL013814 [Ladona fulva]|uniref:Elongation of very long chain fatty acids protein n=1 Tax=Ladona fulva TaxID=123851 RepID=A0A8K0P5V6_LADFU|nr:hypothetical protein J437_LFUL013814 [Ladona fulva]